MMKYFYMFFLVLLTFTNLINISSAQDEATWMPDANLRDAVRSKLNIAAGDALTQADMEDLTSLNAKDSEISTITGLEHATNLESLDLRDNSIISISALSELTSLETLKLKGNDIIDISALSDLTSLTLLNLKDNEITDISALSELTSLEELRLNNNSITDIEPLTSLVNLEKLWIAGNSLTNAHLLSSLTSLTTIDITIPDPPDTTAPDVSISVPSGTQNGAFDVTITFTEVVSDFVQGDLSLGGTATASITAWETTDDTVYTATITPTTSGTVTLDVAADVATDAASNGNTAATQQTVTVDVDAPSVTISIPSGTQNGAFDATITFTEVVSDFVQGDLSLGGTATASIAAWETTDDTVYTATITPTTSGTVTLDVAADVATDAASNGNTAATQQTVTVDVDAPSVTISIPSGTQNGAFDATITFTEVVSDFVQGDLSLGGTATASITAWETTDDTVYTATITPTTSGTVTLDVAADVATDAANNSNTAGSEQTVNVNIDAPGVSISVGSSYTTSGYGAIISPVSPARMIVTVRFTEEVRRDEFDPRLELTFSGPAMTITIAAPWGPKCREVTVDEQTIRLCDEWIYEVTATASGELSLNIAAGVTQDLAGNSNTAATEQTVTVDIDPPEISRVIVPSGPQLGEFNMTIEFTELVSPKNTNSGFRYSYLTISRTTGLSYSKTVELERVDRTTYILTFTPDDGRWSMDGQIRITALSGDAVKDAARNLNLQQSLSESVSPYVSVFGYSLYDVDQDGDVDRVDAILVVQAIGQSGNTITNSRTDVDKDDDVDKEDALLVLNNITGFFAPSSTDLLADFSQEFLETLNPIAITEALNELRLENDGSLKYQRVITFVNAVLSAMRPTEMLLLPNYPNPFNPETWIPYQLPDASDVQITIYDVHGSVVRLLDLGHQPAGYYTNRSHAAHWNGRNAVGEKVASGIYFYQLQADNVSLLRKMLIRK